MAIKNTSPTRFKKKLSTAVVGLNEWRKYGKPCGKIEKTSTSDVFPETVIYFTILRLFRRLASFGSVGRARTEVNCVFGRLRSTSWAMEDAHSNPSIHLLVKTPAKHGEDCAVDYKFLTIKTGLSVFWRQLQSADRARPKCKCPDDSIEHATLVRTANHLVFVGNHYRCGYPSLLGCLYRRHVRC